MHEQATVDLFWSKVDLRGEDECWPWLGAVVAKDGRGIFSANGQRIIAPRFSLSLKIGSAMLVGQFACHSCDNPNCVNPAHLWVGDAKSNAVDASNKGRLANQKKTICVAGHPLSGDNLRVYKDGFRACRECQRVHRRRNNALAKGMVFDGSVAALNAEKTHCKYGHPLSGDNLYVEPKRGFRECRTCRRAKEKARGQK